MSFRTLFIRNRCKLEYSLNQIIYRGVDEKLKININEVSTIMIESTQVAITSALIAKLLENKINIIFCDEKHNPTGELLPYFTAHNSYEKILEQINYKQKTKDQIWKRIIIRKILEQYNNINFLNIKDERLIEYSNCVCDGDSTNREGHAAKVYFNLLFGQKFSRGDESEINIYLNYGYSLLLSLINREVKRLGYLTEIGIHHIGKTNPFNLSCDLMEPLRPLIDYYVIKEKPTLDNFKTKLNAILAIKCVFMDKEYFFDNAVREYVREIFEALRSDNPNIVKFIDYERL